MGSLEGAGFFEREALDISRGRLEIEAAFVDVCGSDEEVEADLAEELAAAGRGGGEDEHVRRFRRGALGSVASTV